MEHLLTTSEMAAADRLTIEAGLSGAMLMSRAGRAVAQCVQSMIKPGGTVLVVCGPGNNGGDGFVVARTLFDRGYTVRLVLAGKIENLRGDALSAALAWQGSLLQPEQATLDEVDVIVDGLFGAGLSREISGELRILVERLNASGKPIIAIDIPSGISGDTGQVRGVAVRAHRTVTFFRRKPGHLLYPGKSCCGSVSVADIGIDGDVLETINPKIGINTPDFWPDVLVPPTEEGHKFSRGHAVVVSGGIESTGAARLAAHAALRAGAGLVTVASPTDSLAVNAAALSDIMVRRSDGLEGLTTLLEDPRRNAVIIGPGNGVGKMTRDRVKAVLGMKRSAVLDADALTSFEAHLDELREALVPEHQELVVATPHEGEFARLFRSQPDILTLDHRLGRARAAAELLGIVIVLKGPDTIIAAPDGRALINANGTPWLATAGSGDVLAGIIGGLLARGVAAFSAAAAGVWLHAEAGREVGPGLAARDLADGLKIVLGRSVG